MHEYSIVASLLSQVAREAAARRARVVQVHVAVGRLSGVDCGLLQTAYEAFRQRGVCAQAGLNITQVDPRWECPRCGGEVEAGAALRCLRCQCPARLAAGDELILERIEMEVGDV